MLKYHVNIMIYENDIRDDNGNYFEFRTHRSEGYPVFPEDQDRV